MKPPALVALDIDGTLLKSDLTFFPGTQEAVDRVKRLGVTPVIATGRRLRSAARYADMLGLSGEPLIVLDGALVLPGGGGPPLVDLPLPDEAWRRAREFAREAGLVFGLFGRDVLALDRPPSRWRALVRAAGRMTWRSASIRQALWELTLVPRRLDRLEAAPPPFYKGFLAGPGIEEMVEPLAGLGLVLTMPPAGANEFILRGVTKGTGLEALAEAAGVGMDRVWAVGNDHNDVDMLRRAGRGILMGNAPRPLLEMFDHVAPPVEEGGVVAALEALASVVRDSDPVVD